MDGGSGPLVASLAAVFPAIIMTTMVALWRAHGEAVPSGAVGPMMLGSTSVSGFALLCVVTFPWAGPFAGAALAWVGATLGITVPAGLWLQARHRRRQLAPARNTG